MSLTESLTLEALLLGARSGVAVALT